MTTIDHYSRRGATVPIATTNRQSTPRNLSGRKKDGGEAPEEGKPATRGWRPLILLTDSHEEATWTFHQGGGSQEGKIIPAPNKIIPAPNGWLRRERESGVNNPQVPVNPSGHHLPPSTPPPFTPSPPTSGTKL